MGGIQDKNRLAGGELHTVKVNLPLILANRTYKQSVHIPAREWSENGIP
jgi:hypothetical protein